MCDVHKLAWEGGSGLYAAKRLVACGQALVPCPQLCTDTLGRKQVCAHVEDPGQSQACLPTPRGGKASIAPRDQSARRAATCSRRRPRRAHGKSATMHVAEVKEGVCLARTVKWNDQARAWLQHDICSAWKIAAFQLSPHTFLRLLTGHAPGPVRRCHRPVSWPEGRCAGRLRRHRARAWEHSKNALRPCGCARRSSP